MIMYDGRGRAKIILSLLLHVGGWVLSHMLLNVPDADTVFWSLGRCFAPIVPS